MEGDLNDAIEEECWIDWGRVDCSRVMVLDGEIFFYYYTYIFFLHFQYQPSQTP